MPNTFQVIYFTDPLCCWSWGFEPVWQKFRTEFSGSFKWAYCMKGLLQDWDHYYDPVNLVKLPIHMGPMWLQAQYVTGQPMNHKMWVEDPPDSSFPACVAFKCIEIQSPRIAEQFLLTIRRKMMLEGLNISNSKLILEQVGILAGQHPGKLNVDQFQHEFQTERGRNLLQLDLERSRKYSVMHSPTLLFLSKGEVIYKLEGYHTYKQLTEKVKLNLPDLKKSPADSDVITIESESGNF